MKKILYLLLLLLFMTGCASDGEAEESYFVTMDINSLTDDGYVVVKEHEFKPYESSETLCPEIPGVSSVLACNSSGEVIIFYEDGNNKSFLFEDENIDIDYVTKSDSKYSPCIIRSENCVYAYDVDSADFHMIANDFLFYLESHQDKYYYVNTAHSLVDSDGNIYCKNVVGVRDDYNFNHTIVYINDK